MARILDQQEQQDLVNAIIKEVQKWFSERQEVHADVDPIILGRLTAVAMGAFLGHLALDVGMSEDTFTRMCNGVYKEAVSKAQQWG